MGDIKNLSGSEALQKMKELIEDKVCLFCTSENGDIVSRPMSTAGVDTDGTIWFMSGKDSMKNQQVKEDLEVYLMYIDTAKQHYVSLKGNANVTYDRAKVEELWSPIAKAYLPEGKDDPNLSLIKVVPTEGHYWDTKNGSVIALLKMAYAAVTGTGNEDDGGVDGQLVL